MRNLQPYIRRPNRPCASGHGQHQYDRFLRGYASIIGLCQQYSKQRRRRFREYQSPYRWAAHRCHSHWLCTTNNGLDFRIGYFHHKPTRCDFDQPLDISIRQFCENKSDTPGNAILHDKYGSFSILFFKIPVIDIAYCATLRISDGSFFLQPCYACTTSPAKSAMLGRC